MLVLCVDDLMIGVGVAYVIVCMVCMVRDVLYIGERRLEGGVRYIHVWYTIAKKRAPIKRTIIYEFWVHRLIAKNYTIKCINSCIPIVAATHILYTIP